MTLEIGINNIERTQFSRQQAEMKTVLLFTAACALVCTAYAAPSMSMSNRDEAQRENDLAKDQFHIHIYHPYDQKDRVAGQGNELAKDQFHIHIHSYYQKDRVAGQGNELAKRQDEDAQRASQQSHETVSAIESLPEQAQVQIFGSLLRSLLG